MPRYMHGHFCFSQITRNIIISSNCRAQIWEWYLVSVNSKKVPCRILSLCMGCAMRACRHSIKYFVSGMQMRDCLQFDNCVLDSSPRLFNQYPLVLEFQGQRKIKGWRKKDLNIHNN